MCVNHRRVLFPSTLPYHAPLLSLRLPANPPLASYRSPSPPSNRLPGPGPGSPRKQLACRWPASLVSASAPPSPRPAPSPSASSPSSSTTTFSHFALALSRSSLHQGTTDGALPPSVGVSGTCFSGATPSGTSSPPENNQPNISCHISVWNNAVYSSASRTCARKGCEISA